ncbi:hypothetical protein BX616_002080 [Lobosporangium transversale]|nr:hypothetical protein BX616_002080 [Lobosporangium transversale]
MSLRVIIGNKTVTFKVAPNDNSLSPRVFCPCCEGVFARNYAKRHYIRTHLDPGYGSDGDNPNDEDPVDTEENYVIPVIANGKRKLNPAPFPASRTNDEIIKRLRGDIPPKMFKSAMESMSANAFKICHRGDSENSYGAILPPETAEFLQELLPREYEILQISDDSNGIDQPNPVDIDLEVTHVPVSEDTLPSIEIGGMIGLERVLGAILETGPRRLRILCAEVYNRDPVEDPHAESTKIRPTSLPTISPATQYEGRLKIVQVPDLFSNRKLVIGVRGYNYLVTSSLCGREALVGPKRCADFPVNHTTKMNVKRQLQDAYMLQGDVLGLAQIRSGFGHLTTYSSRRGALQGFGAPSLMPVSIFTLSQRGVPNCNVFRQLAIRARERNKAKIVLHIRDVDVPEDSDNTKSAEVIRSLRGLFTNGHRITISGNKDAEDLLMKLAQIFSPMISDKNRLVAASIVSEINGS